MNICKCGEEITATAVKETAKLPLKNLNILDYPRCLGCLRILTSSVVRLMKQKKKFSFTGKNK